MRSLTWDRGKELGEHKLFTITTGLEVYFCDPDAHWRRVSNQNNNELLKQNVRKTNDLSIVD